MFELILLSIGVILIGGFVFYVAVREMVRHDPDE